MDSQGSWKPRRSNGKQYHVFEDEQSNYKLSWWPSSGTLFVERNTDFAEETKAKINKIIDKLNLKEDPSEIVKIVKNNQQSKKRNKAKKNAMPKEPMQRSQANQTKEIEEAPNVNKNQEKKIKRLWQAIDELRGLSEYKKHKNELTGTQIQGNNCQDSPSPADKRPKTRRQTRIKEQSKSLVEELKSELVEKENKLNELEKKLEDKHQEIEDLKKQNDGLKQRVLELEKSREATNPREEKSRETKVSSENNVSVEEEKDKPTQDNNESHRKKPKVIIAGDSMIKDLKGSMMVRNKIVKVHAFPGADTADMESYLVKLINKKPDHLILHVGTNNLAVNNAKDVVDKITNLAALVSQKGIKCSVSEIITRDDELWGKVRDVNRILRECLPEHIKLISNDNIKVGHLNRSDLLLR